MKRIYKVASALAVVAFVVAYIVVAGHAVAAAALPLPGAAPVVIGAAPLPGTPAPLSSGQLGDLLGYVFVALGFAFVRPLTALLATWRITCALDPRMISGALSLAFVTGTGLAKGVYGTGLTGILNAVAAGAVAWLYSYGKNRAASLSAEGGISRAALGKANAIGDTSTRGGFVVATPVEHPDLGDVEALTPVDIGEVTVHEIADYPTTP